MKYYVNYIIPLLFLLFVYSCSTEPIETGPFNRYFYCELNGAVFTEELVYNYYCNADGVILYDSLKMASAFVSQFAHSVECKNTEEFAHSHYSLLYNTYTGYFSLTATSEKNFFKFERGRFFSSRGDHVLFYSGENNFFDPIKCRIVDYERDDGKRVVVNDVIDTIPSAFFTADPIETINSASTCDELIPIFQSFYETCREWE